MESNLLLIAQHDGIIKEWEKSSFAELAENLVYIKVTWLGWKSEEPCER